MTADPVAGGRGAHQVRSAEVPDMRPMLGTRTRVAYGGTRATTENNPTRACPAPWVRRHSVLPERRVNGGFWPVGRLGRSLSRASFQGGDRLSVGRPRLGER
ncbi:hypothetical protein SY2F82_23350 [Streptomyces sp. Y2F8-2]|nr:hypothetical protein SY2F82_23350 [Streptomyces sp. Y2F8-2]